MFLQIKYGLHLDKGLGCIRSGLHLGPGLVLHVGMGYVQVWAT